MSRLSPRFSGRSSRQRRRGYGWFVYPSLAVLVGFVGSMFVWNVGISLLRWPGFGSARFVGLGNYQKLAENGDFWESWLHAFFFVLPFCLIPTALGLFLATVTFTVLGTRRTARLAPVVRSGLFLPQVVPLSISALIWLWLVSTSGTLADWLAQPLPMLGLLSTYMIWLETGFAFVVYLAGLSRLDTSLIEAAQLDGANWFQRITHVMVPALRAETGVIVLFLAVGALKVFAPVYYFSGGGPFGSTDTPATFAVLNFFGGKSVGYASAVTTVLALVILSAVGVTLAARAAWRRRQSRRRTT